ncbi:hypothetical protein ABZ806_14670 [Spirillospora sp. NPDC047418]|jgi:hypothetical protein
MGGSRARAAGGIGAMWLLADGADPPWLFSGGLFLHSLASALLIRMCTQAPQASAAKVLAWRPLP